MLKMFSFDTNRRTETFAPLINCVIDDALIETMSEIDHPLLQFIDVMNFRLVDPLLHFSPHFVVDHVQILADGNQRSSEMDKSISRPRRLIFSRAR